MSKEEIYAELSGRFGWSPDVIAGMTPAQQAAYFRQLCRPDYYDEKTGDPIVKFPTWQAAQAFLNSLKR